MSDEEETKSIPMPGCMGAILTWIAALNVIGPAAIVLLSGLSGDGLNALMPVFGLAAINLTAAVAMLKWRKWGYYLYMVAFVGVFFIAGSSMMPGWMKIRLLAEPLLLSFVMFAGGRSSVWSFMK